MSDKIKHFVVKAISKKNKLPVGIDVDTFNYIDTGYVDSMALITFTVELESEFDIEISDDDIMSPDFKTIGGLVSIIKNKLLSEDAD